MDNITQLEPTKGLKNSGNQVRPEMVQGFLFVKTNLRPSMIKPRVGEALVRILRERVSLLAGILHGVNFIEP